MTSPSKPLTPTELDEVRQTHWHSRAGVGPHEAYACGLGTRPCFVARLLATLDATQAVEPGLRTWMEGVVKAWRDYWQGKDHRYGHDFASFVGERLMTDFELRDLEQNTPALAARSSSAPAELEALREALDTIEEDAGWLHDHVPDHSPDGVATLKDIAREIAKEAYRARELLAATARLTSSPENPA
jgi:hypothetical protein